jgi:hypothetical protein
VVVVPVEAGCPSRVFGEEDGGFGCGGCGGFSELKSRGRGWDVVDDGGVS